MANIPKRLVFSTLIAFSIILLSQEKAFAPLTEPEPEPVEAQPQGSGTEALQIEPSRTIPFQLGFPFESGSADLWINSDPQFELGDEPNDASIAMEPTEPQPDPEQEEIDRLERLAQVYKDIAQKFKDAADQEQKRRETLPPEDSFPLLDLAIFASEARLSTDALSAENESLFARQKAMKLREQRAAKLALDILN